MKLLLTAITSLALLGSSSAVHAQAPCPQNYFSIAGPVFYEEFSNTPIASWGGMSYDLIAGTITAGNTGSGEAGATATVAASDRYRLVGPASGTPLPLQVRVRFTGTAGAGLVFLPGLGNVCLVSQATLRLTAGSAFHEKQPRSSSSPCAAQPFDETLFLDLQKLPGEEFVVSTSAALTCGHTIQATAAGVLTFAVPDGYTIQSCQGYAGQPVAVARRTWGRIKQLYR